MVQITLKNKGRMNLQLFNIIETASVDCANLYDVILSWYMIEKLKYPYSTASIEFNKIGDYLEVIEEGIHTLTIKTI